MFSSEAWLSNSSGFYNGVATQSLRFDDGSSAYLNRTFSSSNRKTWTWSGWVKRSSLSGATLVLMYTGSGGGVARGGIVFNSSEQLEMQMNPTGNAWKYIKTNALHRDTSAWYHIVAVLDTTQATESNRQKFYVNGTQQTLSSASYPTLNQDYPFNLGTPHYIGSSVGGGSNFDGYLAEANFVDGTALDPTSFGETKNGVWIPKKYTGSYGTNGFRLQFNQTGTGTASTSTIGADTSGNTNHYTSSGIVASDCNMPDSPELNMATLNAIEEQSRTTTFSEGNLQALIPTASSTGKGLSTIAVSSGKWYWEIYYKSSTGNFLQVGVQTTDASKLYYIRGADGERWDNGSVGSATSTRFSATSVIGVALDLDNGKWYIANNNTYQDAGNGAGDPTGGSGQVHSGLSGEFQFYTSNATSSGTQTYVANFGQDSSFAGNKTAQGNTDANGIGDFYYAPPSGFLALCTSNLPEPTISPNALTQADDYFNTVLWNGNNSTQSITGVGFQPDWLWIKNRSSSSFGHSLTDSSRGANEVLSSDSTDDEFTNANNVNAFTSDGFNLGNTSFSGYSNQSGSSYVGWNWKANGGTTSSNSDGSITSTVQANTTAGFSIVTYTGTGSLSTVGHSLGVKPSMMIIKNRDDSDSGSAHWLVYHEAIGATHRLKLDSTEASGATSVHFNNTEPTSSVFTVNTSNAGNGSGDNLIAYCFAEIEGFSRFGKYTGNGNLDGTFVYTGFRPAWVMTKSTTISANWTIIDTTRKTFNLDDARVHPDLSDGEYSNDGYGWDMLSNGFKHRTTVGTFNSSGTGYIYMAFAENPFKYANAR